EAGLPLSTLPQISVEALREKLGGGGLQVLDVRREPEWAAGHVPGSINIALSGQFASWAGALLGLAARPVLIAESQEAVSEARMRLARIGLEDARGYLKGGVEAWIEAGLPLSTLPQISVEALREKLGGGGLQVLDVRREPEWAAGHIEGAGWWPLDNFKVAPPEIDRDVPIAVHCKGGYRSMIACSLLERAGFRNVTNMVGGFDAWQQAGLPVVTEKPVEA
ncbi:MAG: rhodanese-like domain-containing protein, partial [Terriglobales bacterium]